MCLCGAQNTHYTTYFYIYWYGAVCWDPYRGVQVSALNRVQMRADTFACNINESIWVTLAQRRFIARICPLFKAYTGRRAWKGIGNILLKTCYLSRGHHNRKVRNGKQKQILVNFPP